MLYDEHLCMSASITAMVRLTGNNNFTRRNDMFTQLSKRMNQLRSAGFFNITQW